MSTIGIPRTFMSLYQSSLELEQPDDRAIRPAGASPFNDPRLPTFAGMMEEIRHDPMLSAQQRADLRSALRSFGDLIGQDLRAMPALPTTYRSRLRRLTPAATGLSSKRLANIKAGVLRAMARYGALPRRNALGPRASAWIPLWDRLTTYQRARLSRFVSWCSATGIMPSAVSDTVVERFEQALIEESFIEHPADCVVNTCRIWEKVRSCRPELALPAVSIPRLRKTYVLPAAAFSSSFIIDLDRFCRRLGGADPFAEEGPLRPLKPRSVKCRRFQIMQLASACVHNGVAAAGIRSLSDLVVPETLRAALTFFLKRAGGKTTVQISNLAVVARMIARHWAHCEEQTLRQIVHLTGKVSMRQRGLTDKNRARLRQFDDRRNLERLLFYPADVMDELRRIDDSGVRGALQAAIAVAVAVLLAAPIRLANLAALRLDVHVLRTRAARDSVWHLVLAAHETKNSEPREYQLGPETVALLQEYLGRYRPRLAERGNDHLFPSGRGHKAANTLATALSQQVFRRTGLEVNPHLFRHLAAKLILEATPGAYGIVQDVLGHRDAATTRNYYAGSETAAAARHFDAVIRQTRAALRGNGHRIA
jgi:site-specific recombinase XerD